MKRQAAAAAERQAAQESLIQAGYSRDYLAKFEARADALLAQIKPLLAGQDADLQGAVLAELVAIWVAGHIVVGDPEATRATQAELLESIRDAAATLAEHYRPKGTA